MWRRYFFGGGLPLKSPSAFGSHSKLGLFRILQPKIDWWGPFGFQTNSRAGRQFPRKDPEHVPSFRLGTTFGMQAKATSPHFRTPIRGCAFCWRPSLRLLVFVFFCPVIRSPKGASILFWRETTLFYPFLLWLRLNGVKGGGPWLWAALCFAPPNTAFFGVGAEEKLRAEELAEPETPQPWADGVWVLCGSPFGSQCLGRGEICLTYIYIYIYIYREGR